MDMVANMLKKKRCNFQKNLTLVKIQEKSGIIIFWKNKSQGFWIDLGCKNAGRDPIVSDEIRLSVSIQFEKQAQNMAGHELKKCVIQLDLDCHLRASKTKIIRH